MKILRNLFRKSTTSTTPSDAEHLDILLETFEAIGGVLGDGLNAFHIGPHFSCREADVLALAMAVGGQLDAAAAFLEGHASGDSATEDDVHLGGEGFDGRRYLEEAAEIALAAV